MGVRLSYGRLGHYIGRTILYAVARHFVGRTIFYAVARHFVGRTIFYAVARHFVGRTIFYAVARHFMIPNVRLSASSCRTVFVSMESAALSRGDGIPCEFFKVSLRDKGSTQGQPFSQCDRTPNRAAMEPSDANSPSRIFAAHHHRQSSYTCNPKPCNHLLQGTLVPSPSTNKSHTKRKIPNEKNSDQDRTIHKPKTLNSQINDKPFRRLQVCALSDPFSTSSARLAPSTPRSVLPPHDRPFHLTDVRLQAFKQSTVRPRPSDSNARHSMWTSVQTADRSSSPFGFERSTLNVVERSNKRLFVLALNNSDFVSHDCLWH
ncbi:hypothetical protein LR48_Vigan02g009200 [Vigna angularis]|uniref:Uncharacterized protein n=1 Tax=Phaseolus angularis TaxID=3914 RepID=A0A0L9TU89_PHAAN|nr:hypothetical protein LR48_Vigan02g009200 [Vigna angularis]